MIRNKKFIANTFLLTAVSLVMRAVGVSFNVYIANKIGANGMGLFSLIMSVYAFGVTLACSGINLASTKIVSEELAVGSYGGVVKCIRMSLIYSLIFGSMATLIIFFGANFFGNVFLGDGRTVRPLMILSLSLPCVSMSSAVGGYFIAVGRVYKNALVQLLEQFFRVAGCVAFLNLYGLNNAETACNLVVLSGIIAEILSFILIMLLLKGDLKKYKKASLSENILKRILGVSIPIAISSYVRSALSTIEHTLIPKGLRKYGGGKDEALSVYGVVHGMVMPIIFFPSAILCAFSSLLMPEITMYHKVGDAKRIKNAIEKSLFIALTFSLGTSGILYFFAEEIGLLIYKNSQAAHFLKILAPLAAIMYLDGVVDAILKGLNQQVYSMGYNIFESAISVLLLFTYLPIKGIDAYILILYITEGINAFLSINRLIKVADFNIYPVRWTLVPTAAIVSSVYFVKGIDIPLTNSSGLVVSIFLSVLIYFLVIFLYTSKGHKTLVAKKLVLW
ncbi:MAG: polysaccharide biosynthesis protein [Clostridia bacterium]|nr:polysaccharide biosynthesis protein [Clostridia bacterium]